jgi:hypothetical protein
VDRQVTCPHCQFVFVVVPGLGLERTPCPRCSRSVALPNAAQTDWGGYDTILLRQQFRWWGRVFWALALPLLLCCVFPTYVREIANQGHFFNTILTGVSALTLLGTGIALDVIGGWPLERIAHWSKQITHTAWLLMVLATVGLVFGALLCFN